MAYGLRLQLV